MSRNRASRWAFVALASLFLTACTSPGPDPLPSPTSVPPTTGTPTLAPAVEEPISLGDRWKKPCELIRTWDLEDFGFGDEKDGKQYQAENGSACGWTGVDPTSKTKITLDVVAYPDHDILGETYRTAPVAAGAFKPFGYVIPKLPSAFVAENSTSCSYVVGFSAHQGVKLTYTRQSPFEVEDIKRKCAVPYSVATALVRDIARPTPTTSR